MKLAPAVLAPSVLALVVSVSCTGLEPLPDDTEDTEDTQDSADTVVDDSGEPNDSGPAPVDADNDGYPTSTDCDDANPDVHPNLEVRVDGRDSDCNGRREWRVTLHLAVDDIGSACIDSETNLVLPEGGQWTTARTAEFWLESGAHTVGINGRDLGRVITAAAAHLEAAGQVIVTDADWTYDPNPTFQDTTRSGWCSPGFDDSTWLHVKVIGPVFVTAPWTNAPSGFPATSPASWVWDHYPVELNTQYLRRTFTLP